jgi:hypothetical protein
MTLSTHAALGKDRRDADTAKLQHRHYAAIAAIIAGLDDPAKSYVAHRFAARLQSSNPRFSESRFLAACDVQS